MGGRGGEEWEEEGERSGRKRRRGVGGRGGEEEEIVGGFAFGWAEMCQNWSLSISDCYNQFKFKGEPRFYYITNM